ncbi:MAG TPA: hypothetical protein VHH15_07225 [Actinophytocola sp.]|nr:hypothetical protein [Actinophytocola sp.]
MESLTWTSDRGPLPADLPRAIGRGCGWGCGTVVGGLTAVVLCLVVGLAWWWGAVAWVAVIVLATAAGRGMGRMVPNSMEFTRSAVSLIRPNSTVVVDLAQVQRINVQHSGEKSRTTVQVTYAAPVGEASVAVTNRYDPDLAEMLARVLGPEVTILETRSVDL